MAKFYMVPIDHNGFWSSFTPKNCHVADVTQTRGESVYSFNNPQKYIVSSCCGFNFLPHYLFRAPTPHKGRLEAVRYPSGI